MLILKQLRKKKNISQSDLAAIIGVSLRTIQLYEKENANIPIKNLNKIAAYFEMGIDQLYAKEVNESDIIYDSSNTDLRKAHTIRKLGSARYLLSAPLITGDLQQKYLDDIDNKGFLNNLPQVGFFVDQVSDGAYLAFEILNDSMNNGLVNGIPQGTIVLGKRISYRALSQKENSTNSIWILVGKNTIMCKEIKAFDQKKNLITCHSLNSSLEYPDFVVSATEVMAFYKLIKKQVN